MTFEECVVRPVNHPHILLELDISSINTQWVSAGAGIWKVNFNNIYTEIDSTLLDGFTVQDFDNVASMRSNNNILVKVDTLLEVSTNYESFYYDSLNKTLYVTLQNYDDPILHILYLGIISGFSKEEFSPKGKPILYEGRLSTVPTLGMSRDPLYFGKISYDSATFQIINADGVYDNFADIYDVYGNPGRLLFGYDEIDYDEYQLIYSGYIETIKVAEDYMSVKLMDDRKKLSKKVYYTCTNKNALDVIYELLLLNNPSINYSGTYFNVTQWELTRELVPNISIYMELTDTEEISSLIEKVCTSSFGLFIIQPDGLYTFKVINTDSSAAYSIYRNEIITETLSIEYDPSQVISSTKITYGALGASVLNDVSYESDVYKKYKIYKEQEFTINTPTANATQEFSDKIMEYFKDVHGQFDIDVPMIFYNLDFAGLVNVQINRENSTMLGVKKCEILNKEYNLTDETIKLELRIVESSIIPNYAERILTTGEERWTTAGSKRVVTSNILYFDIRYLTDGDTRTTTDGEERYYSY
jgi:hypothetical protein